MVKPGSLGKYKPSKPTTGMYWTLVLVLTAFGLGGGYLAGIQPAGQWRYFSWHPFLMTLGMVGFAGVATVTKKMGGYVNTKSHAVLAWGSVILSLCGLYCIYKNKENNGYSHLKTAHSRFGLAVFVSCVGLGLVGSIVLHPDFGIDKANQTIRFWHKWGARCVLTMAWITSVLGLMQLTNDSYVLLSFGIPLLVLFPFVLM